MIVLDTDILTILQRGDGDEFRRVMRRWRAAPGEVDFVTIVSYEEQTRGWLAAIARARTHDRICQAYARLRAHLEDYCGRRLLDFDERAGEIFRQLAQSRIRIGTLDLRIAAIALANDATLITRNLADFSKVPGLRCEDWTAE